MNKKAYWKIRKIILALLFRIKAWFFRVVDYIESFWEYHNFRGVILRGVFFGVIKSGLIAIILLFLDRALAKMLVHLGVTIIPTIDYKVFIDVIIGSIGVAGVILGLYCANISSIYATRYANAPEEIAKAFQSDRLTRKSISSIISFIIFGFIVIFEMLFGIRISWISVVVIIILAISVLIAYSIAGNRSYQLSVIYHVADDAYTVLHRIISKGIHKSFFSLDSNFQNYYMKVADKETDLLISIEKYGRQDDCGDRTTMVDFIKRNLILIREYWACKQGISEDSLWFRNEVEYKKWHLSNSTETTLALRTGTSLGTKSVRNYWWFENKIMLINHSCLKGLIEKHNYGSFYQCLSMMELLSEVAIPNREIGYYLKQIEWLEDIVNANKSSEPESEDVKSTFAGIVEMISVLYLGLILQASKYYQQCDIGNKVDRVVKAFDTNHSADKAALLFRSKNKKFFDSVYTEIYVEGKRITPTWLLEQYVAKDEYDYLNTIIDSICEGMDRTFEFGEAFFEEKAYLEACIILTKYFEFEAKLNGFIRTITLCEEKLRQYQIDLNMKWDEFRLGKLIETQKKWKESILSMLQESSSEFALENWEHRESYPDFLGDSYNRICEDAIDAIINKDSERFSQDYAALSKLMILYQEYIRTDFIKDKDKYRIEYVFYMFTSPIVEWAQIGGLAILWGEFSNNQVWFEKVNESAKAIFMHNKKPTNFAEVIIEYIRNRDDFLFGIGDRGVVETDWNLRVARAIREWGQYSVEYTPFGVRMIDTNSKLLKAFCYEFDDMGFINNPAEVFWVMCLNPLLPEEKCFRTRNAWEKKLDD